MKILTKEGYIDAVALFLEITDEELKEIEKDSNFFLNSHMLNSLIASKGDNAHFFGLFNTNGNMLHIHKYFEELFKKYKTISWWDRELNKFRVIRR